MDGEKPSRNWWWDQWSQIQGNAKWDLIKWLLKRAGIFGFLGFVMRQFAAFLDQQPPSVWGVALSVTIFATIPIGWLCFKKSCLSKIIVVFMYILLIPACIWIIPARINGYRVDSSFAEVYERYKDVLGKPISKGKHPVREDSYQGFYAKAIVVEVTRTEFIQMFPESSIWEARDDPGHIYAPKYDDQKALTKMFPECRGYLLPQGGVAIAMYMDKHKYGKYRFWDIGCREPGLHSGSRPKNATFQYFANGEMLGGLRNSKDQDAGVVYVLLPGNKYAKEATGGRVEAEDLP